MKSSRQSLKNRKTAKDRTLGATVLSSDEKRCQPRRLRRNGQMWEEPREIDGMGTRGRDSRERSFLEKRVSLSG